MLTGSVPDGSLQDSERMLKKASRMKSEIITANFQMALTYMAMDDKERKNIFLKSHYPSFV